MVMSTIRTETLDVHPRGSDARFRRAAAIAVASGLVAGGVGGYALRWGTEPSKTVITTVTRTVRAPAYATGPAQSAYVYYDGTRAYYSGPTHLTRGAKLTIHFGTTVKDAAIATGDVPPTYTWETVAHDATVGHFSQRPDYLTDVVWWVGPGEITVTSGTGLMEVVVGTAPPPQGTDSVALATLIETS
jgi:hypothetical protein